MGTAGAGAAVAADGVAGTDSADNKHYCYNEATATDPVLDCNSEWMLSVLWGLEVLWVREVLWMPNVA